MKWWVCAWSLESRDQLDILCASMSLNSVLCALIIGLYIIISVLNFTCNESINREHDLCIIHNMNVNVEWIVWVNWWYDDMALGVFQCEYGYSKGSKKSLHGILFQFYLLPLLRVACSIEMVLFLTWHYCINTWYWLVHLTYQLDYFNTIGSRLFNIKTPL